MGRHTIRVLIVAVAAAANAQQSGAPEKIDLRGALEQADKASPEIQLARLRKLEKDAQAAGVKSGLGPQVALQVGGNYQTTNLQGIGIAFPGVPSRVGGFSVFDARPTLQQAVLDLSLLARWRAARAAAGQAAEDASATAEQTRLAIVELYLRALQAESRSRAAAARLQIAEASLKQASDAEEGGKGTKLDVARARQQVEKERVAAAFAERDRGALVVRLMETAGWPANPDAAMAPVGPAPGILPQATAALFDEAMSRRHEMRSLEKKQAVLEQERRAAEAQRYPTITFQADYGVLGESPWRNVSTYLVGATVNMPLWTSGRIASEIKAARNRQEQWREERRRQELAIRREIAESVDGMKRSAEAATAAMAGAVAAREALELATLRFQAGLTTNLDVTAAQSALAEAQEEEIRANYEALLARARLAQARGDIFLFF